MRAVLIGECMVELREAAEGLLSKAFAGDAYNTAVNLKRSAPDARVQFLSATGADPLSQAMRATWRAEGVEDDLAFTDPDRTPGLYLIELDAASDRRFHYWRSDSAARQWMQRLRAGGGDPLSGADLVYLSGISLAILPPEEREQALLLMKWLRGRVGLIAFDPQSARRPVARSGERPRGDRGGGRPGRHRAAERGRPGGAVWPGRAGSLGGPALAAGRAGDRADLRRGRLPDRHRPGSSHGARPRRTRRRHLRRGRFVQRRLSRRAPGRGFGAGRRRGRTGRRRPRGDRAGGHRAGLHLPILKEP